MRRFSFNCVTSRRNGSGLQRGHCRKTSMPRDENAARDALCPLAAKLARIARCSLRIEYVDSNDFDEETADEIARHRTSTAPSSFSAT